MSSNLFNEPLDTMLRQAHISDCGRFRYQLTRQWSDERPACFICLNPSTADAVKDDPTVRRLIGFAKAWGCGGLHLVNLFAFRSTDPYAMKEAADAVGPHNDSYIRTASFECWPLVAAWGTHGGYLLRDRTVMRIVKECGTVLKCLGVTKDGYPKHPLYIANGTPLIPFPLTAKDKTA